MVHKDDSGFLSCFYFNNSIHPQPLPVSFSEKKTFLSVLAVASGGYDVACIFMFKVPSVLHDRLYNVKEVLNLSTSVSQYLADDQQRFQNISHLSIT